MKADLTEEQQNGIWERVNKTIYGFAAADLIQGEIETVVIPNQIRDEIPTLNQYGYMKIDLDEYTEPFVREAAINEGYNLELGTAYGYVAQQVLKVGGKFIANDISAQHLEVLLKETPQEHIGNLFLYPGRFPAEINLPDNSMSSILTSRMIHFLDTEEIERGFKKIHDWLMFDGRFYFTSVTPYHAALREKFLPIYQERAKNGDKWPGRIENHREISPLHAPYVQDFLQVFDVPQLEELLPKHGFKIERISLFDYPNDTDSGGKGHVGFVARKI